MGHPLTVLADDFTGALDTGVKFAAIGIKTVVCFYDKAESPPDTPVIVWNTESRHVQPEIARNRISALVPKDGTVYKKTDSTLRGNIGAELQALSDSRDGQNIAFVPAYPATGRTTKHGVQYVDGVPLAETGYGRDPVDPVRYSSVADIIAQQSGLPVVCNAGEIPSVTVETTRGTVFVYDAATDDDLSEIAKRLRSEGYQLYAGCAGFAPFLPPVSDLSAARHGWGNTPLKPPNLLVAGSVNPLSMRQSSQAVAEGWYDFVIPPEVLFTPENTRRQETARELKSIVAEGRQTVLRSARSEHDIERNNGMAASYGIGGSAIASAIAETLASVAAPSVQSGPITSVLVFGGDTAGALCRHLSIDQMYPLSEPLPGIVYSTAEIRSGAISVWTKAGGFGTDTVVADIQRQCKRRDG